MAPNLPLSILMALCKPARCAFNCSEPLALPEGKILATWSTPMRSASDVCRDTKELLNQGHMPCLLFFVDARSVNAVLGLPYGGTAPVDGLKHRAGVVAPVLLLHLHICKSCCCMLHVALANTVCATPPLVFMHLGYNQQQCSSDSYHLLIICWYTKCLPPYCSLP
eukprot:GHRR01014337.1.p1 GENE.GHRR01014337.1~~GHRR01014337.1.p1  ORF type:complete len:166 (-),score=25.13 GHRR01014337.1:652-1149(-)